jgi:phage terminase large subunit
MNNTVSPVQITPQDFLSKYQNDPVAFFTDVLDVKPEHVWGKMREVAESVLRNQFTCVKAGNSLSKSYTVSRLALWFLYCHYPSTVITTAPSHNQVESIIWKEIAEAHALAKVPLGGEMLKTSLDLQKATSGRKWFAVGFSTKPDTVTNQATRLQGYHNENVLVILDEAAGILPEIYDAVMKLLTTPKQKLIAIGNPTIAHGNFVDCFKDKKFNKITISVLDSPNYIEGKEIIPGLSGREFVEHVKDKWGETSNYYKAMVLGEIPDEDVDALLPLAWIEKAEGKKVDHYFGYLKRFITWDVADGGEDLHVIKAWENTTEIDSVEVQGKKVEEVEPQVWRMLRKVGGNAIIVDGDGIGRVAVSLLEQSKDKAVKIIPFYGSDKNVNEPETFENKRHEAAWQMRNLFEKEIISISNIPEQREELASIKLTLHRKGYIAVEKKADLKKRIGRSPDRMDAIMMMAGMIDEVPALDKEKKKRYGWRNWKNRLYNFTPETV